MAEKYDHQAIEKKWQKRWDTEKVFSVDKKATGKHEYILDMFPYPSGDGLHVGHPEGYTATDIYSRFLRMNGQKVLHPMGWDAFGLPAENAAIKKGIHPSIVTEQNIKNFKRQIQSIGFSYDWEREINTTDPKYYKWTQWIFLQLFKRGLAYEKESPIWWCPKDKTGLANEEVVNGCCERCGTPVEKKMLRQWMLKITSYADRLLDGLNDIDWPESIKALQRNWIGKSEGAEITFVLRGITGQDDDKHQVKVFTTRPDTLFGATFLVISPELANSWLSIGWQAPKKVQDYITKALTRTEIARQDTNSEKTGVDSGIQAVHPITKEQIPVWIADYVLGGYGTGAIMAVPAHDERDHVFAKKYSLPITTVIEPVTGEPKEKEEFRRSIVAIVQDPKTDKVLTINWGEKSGGTLFIGGGREQNEDPVECAKREIAEETGYIDVELLGQSEIIHHHYFAHSKNVARNIEAIGLFFKLKSKKQNKPSLEKDEKEKFTVVWASTSEVDQEVRDPLHRYVFEKFIKGVNYTGEGIMVNSGKFDGLESSAAREKIVAWLEQEGQAKFTVSYKLRDWVFSRQRYWGEPIPLVHCEKDGVVSIPEDQLPLKLPSVEKYEPTGTGESPLASITAWVNTECPKCGGPAKRETNTMPQWAGSCWYYLRFCDPNNDKEFASMEAMKAWLPVNLYVGGAEHAVLHLLYARFWHKVLFDAKFIPKEVGDEPFKKLKNQGLILGPDGEKMSKSRGNVISPDEIVEKYGADTLRMYEMFMGPFEDAKPWDTNGILGVRRFLDKVWRVSENLTTGEAEDTWHRYSKTITEGLNEFRFNTCVSDLMKWLNEWSSYTPSNAEFSIFLQHLNPFAPHISDELWEKIGNQSMLEEEKWPIFDKTKILSQDVTYAIQVNGKLRQTYTIARGWAKENVIEEVRKLPNVLKFLTGEPKKIIFVQDKLINFVI